MNTTIGERLKQLALSKDKSTRAFEQKCGITLGCIAKESNIRIDTLAKILIAYPDVDLYWILLGQSTKKVNENTSQSVDDGSPLVTNLKLENERLWGVIKNQQETINNLINVNIHINNN